jgi:coenzyme F420-dependent glucose-6-phosphate dehydrogenase
MVRFGYKLCSEEHTPLELVRFGRAAEGRGFAFAMISDHFQPLGRRAGGKPVRVERPRRARRSHDELGARNRSDLPHRAFHPALVAQASATIAELAPGRFSLGLGTGENLNEHIFGDAWPGVATRRSMLREAVEVIRTMWSGDWVDHRGEYFRVERARLYTAPEEPPPILIAASGQRAAEMAGEIGNGLIGLAPNHELVTAFDGAGGTGQPRYAEITVCWGEDERAARETAATRWPNAGIPGELSAELPLPRHFEQAAGALTVDQLTEKIPCGPNVETHVETIKAYIDAGFDHIWFHQIGPAQEEFLTAYAEDVLPKVA